MGKSTVKRNHEPLSRRMESRPSPRGGPQIVSCALCRDDMKSWKGDVINVECCARMCGGTGRFHAHCVRTHFDILSAKERKRLGISDDQVYTSSANCFKSFPCVVAGCKGKITRSGFERGTEKQTCAREAYDGSVPRLQSKAAITMKQGIPTPRREVVIETTTKDVLMAAPPVECVETASPGAPPLVGEQRSFFNEPKFCTNPEPTNHASGANVIYGWTPFNTPVLFDVFMT